MDYMIAQARALRALSYYHAVDLFGNVPFATEENSVGATGPEQIKRPGLYAWLVEEITGENGFREDLLPISQTEYGRVSQEFATMLLAKLYLNAEVFTDGQVSAWAECAEESARIVNTMSHNNGENCYQGNFSAGNTLNPEDTFSW